MIQYHMMNMAGDDQWTPAVRGPGLVLVAASIRSDMIDGLGGTALSVQRRPIGGGWEDIASVSLAKEHGYPCDDGFEMRVGIAARSFGGEPMTVQITCEPIIDFGGAQ